MKYKKMILASLFAALCCLATLFIQIPIPQGYINLGDLFVLLSGWLLGPLWGTAAAGIGSMLADLFGYAIYAPATLIIKALMALSASRISKKSNLYLWGGLVAELIMVFGYFAYESLFLGLGLGAAAWIPFNLIQGAVSLGLALAFMQIFRKNSSLQKMLHK